MTYKPKFHGVIDKAPIKKRNTTSRIRRGVRLNQRDAKWLKEEAIQAYPGKRSFKALYVEKALEELISRETLVSADFENPDDHEANEFTQDLMVYMNDDNLMRSTEIFYIERGLHERIYGYEVKIRRFLEMHRDWFQGVPPMDRIFPGLFRFAIAAKVGKDHAIRRFNELNTEKR